MDTLACTGFSGDRMMLFDGFVLRCSVGDGVEKLAQLSLILLVGDGVIKLVR